MSSKRNLLLNSFLFLGLTIITPSHQTCERGPNVLFILIDDVGWADFGYNNKMAIKFGAKENSDGQIPTPNIDRLAEKGLKLTSHYVHPTCTPSRASFMTGRYASSTGMPFASLPGAVTGLPESFPTLPQLLRKAGYSAHMVGKWHLGHAQPKQTPVGRGFESFIGSYLWNLDSYTKFALGPTGPLGIDWVQEFENGSYEHQTEPRHSTLAITDKVIQHMKEHKHGDSKDNPLFLYVSYNAAHSPCMSEPEWEAACLHIPHVWRRQYCGMVVGLDLAIREVTDHAKEILGDNTVIVVSSDNGANPWLGGMNAPFRSGKLSPFEGGVRVPAFALDLSQDKKYLGKDGREFGNIIHISDWLPTFLSWAGKSYLLQNIKMDGIDQSKPLRGKEKVPLRQTVLLDLYTTSHDGTSTAAFRKNKYKLIQGHVKDPHWYNEPKEDKINTSDLGSFVRTIEHLVRFTDWIFGLVSNDPLRDFLSAHFLLKTYAEKDGFQTLLFDIENDPQEIDNLADKHPEIVKDILKDIEYYKKEIPESSPYWMVTNNWHETFVTGDCSTQKGIPEKYGWCRFTHPWYPDSTDLLQIESLGLVNGVDKGLEDYIRFYAFRLFYVVLLPLLVFLIVVKICTNNAALSQNNIN